RCYICRLAVHVPHKTCKAMCIPCGDFNTAGSELSMPGNLDLSGKTALVTGARVNLGYHVALRLLRCGARVIVSSRYPRDAVSRYEAESDSSAWIDRLRIVGADFRSARDAFDLVSHVRSIISAWGGRLDILINNAAQTLTDSVKTEGQAVHRENILKDKVSMTPLLQHQYSARVRGGVQATIEGAEDTADLNERSNPNGGGAAPGSSKDMVPLEDKSSWVQSLSEIPYEDVISAHSVNTFVPLILIRELLPLMGDITASPPSSQDNPNRPAGYVINVSSREGIFESSRSNPHKAGRHVHTNMSKAALNMITETEAGPAWGRRRVVINTVNPGYMSAAPEMEEAYDGVRPIGWEDGAGRVLWPVAIGEGGQGTRGGGVVWGRFLKHYGAVRVEPGWGRG
ncbi:NAD(P)-binding protein, partial [Coniochaeta ligniaria NRRL 30616]